MELQNVGETRRPLTINLTSDKQLDCDLCSKMVIGIIKHILYNRDQIPQPFEQMALSSAAAAAATASNVLTVSGSSQRIRDMKLNAVVQSLSELFNHIMLEMKADRAIQRVVVALGNTFLSPKEIHCIEIPPLVTTARSPLTSLASHGLNRQTVISQLFKSLFVSSGAIRWSPLNPTNIHVLLEMKRCDVSWFHPKTFYKLSANNPRLIVYKWKLNDDVNASSSSSSCQCDPLKTTKVDEDDLVWYSTPITIKGFS